MCLAIKQERIVYFVLNKILGTLYLELNQRFHGNWGMYNVC